MVDIGKYEFGLLYSTTTKTVCFSAAPLLTGGLSFVNRGAGRMFDWAFLSMFAHCFFTQPARHTHGLALLGRRQVCTGVLDVLWMFSCNLTALISQMATVLCPGILTPVPRNSSEPVRRFTIPSHQPHPIVAPRNPTNPVMHCVPQPLPLRFSKPEIGPISLANIPHHLPVQMPALPPPSAY